MIYLFVSIGFILIEVVFFCCFVVKEGVEDCCCVVVMFDVGCCVVMFDVVCCVVVIFDVISVYIDFVVDMDLVVVELWIFGDEVLLVFGVIVDGFVDVLLLGISVFYKMYMVISIKIYLLIYIKWFGL